MEKLIEHFAESGEEYEAILACKDYCQNDGIASCSCKPIIEVRKKLFQYESTGLEPDEIKKMVQDCKLCTENENFVQNKFGYCFYSLGPCPLIYNLYVHPQYRRCGSSKRLLELAIGEIRESGYNGEIYVQVKPKENSISLNGLTEYYKRMGLTIFEK